MIIERCYTNPLRHVYGITKQRVLFYFGISRQAHRRQLLQQRRREGEAAIIIEMVQVIRAHHPRMGVRKILHKLQPQLHQRGIQLSRDRLFDLLRARGLLVPVKRRATKTTRSGLFRCPNLLTNLTLEHMHQVWVGDITYLTLQDNFVYLALLTDAFSRFIAGFDLSRSLAVTGCQRALHMALRHTDRSFDGLIHHSDHGVQYTAHIYRDTLAQHRIRSSMGEVGNCYENALAERMNGIPKIEYGLDALFVNFDQALLATKQAIALYNYDRPHLSLDYHTPADIHFGRNKLSGSQEV